MLTVSEVALQLRCKPDLVRSLITRGKLRAISLSEKRKHYRVKQAWIDEFLERESTAIKPNQAARVPAKSLSLARKYFD